MTLRGGLSSRNGFVRKGSAALLRVPKWFHSLNADDAELAARPPVLANSVPKSGTHLLAQIVEGLPDRVNYGEFLSSMTSSFQFRERTVGSIHRFINRILPGEIVRAHLFFDERYVEELRQRNIVHYFVYRDPRDVVLSGAHYVRSMNRWHKLHRYFRDMETLDDVINLSIRGLQPAVPGVDFPDIATRYGRYCGWLDHENCMAIRFESFISESRDAIVRSMAEFYAAHASTPIDLETCTRTMLQSIAPHKSHTFRSGEKAGWRKAFKPAHRLLFHEVAGELLIKLGYEQDTAWVDQS